MKFRQVSYNDPIFVSRNNKTIITNKKGSI